MWPDTSAISQMCQNGPTYFWLVGAVICLVSEISKMWVDEYKYIPHFGILKKYIPPKYIPPQNMIGYYEYNYTFILCTSGPIDSKNSWRTNISSVLE